jgi:hypothetical protein
VAGKNKAAGFVNGVYKFHARKVRKKLACVAGRLMNSVRETSKELGESL